MLNTFRQIFSIGLFTAAVIGLLLSVSHYHNETMECLDHVSEQHFSEYIPLCPICIVASDNEGIQSTEHTYYPELAGQIFEKPHKLYISLSLGFNQNRAPPALS